MKTAARLYVRVSTEDQAREGYSLAAQVERLEAYALANGWVVRERYIDDGYSAKDTNRPALQKLLREIGRGEVLLVYKLDRLTRSVGDLADLLQQFERQAIEFASANERIDTTTATGRLMLRLIVEIAQWEREVIGERTAMGLQRKVAQGEWQGGPVPFGYDAVPSDRMKNGKPLLKLVPNSVTGPLVDKIFKRYLSGYGVRAVCLWLNDELQVRTTGGARFRQPTVIRILQNPIYCGDVFHGKRKRGSETRVRGGHEPLVDRDVFEQVQALFAARRTMAPRQATGKYPLSGIGACGVCGGRLDGLLRRTKGGGEFYVYRCYNYINGVGCGDGLVRPLASVSGRVVEGNLVEAIAALEHPDGRQRFYARLDAEIASADAGSEVEVKRLEVELAKAEAAIKRWDLLYEAGRITPEQYLDKTGPHSAAVVRIKDSMRQHEAKPAQPERAALAMAAREFKRAWEHLEAPERKALLQQFVRVFRAQILVYPERRVEVEFASPRPLHV